MWWHKQCIIRTMSCTSFSRKINAGSDICNTQASIRLGF